MRFGIPQRDGLPKMSTSIFRHAGRLQKFEVRLFKTVREDECTIRKNEKVVKRILGPNPEGLFPQIYRKR
jgi:hypothetical protein